MATDTYIRLDDFRNALLRLNKTGVGKPGKRLTDLEIMNMLDNIPHYNDIVPKTEFNNLLMRYKLLNANMIKAGMIMQSEHNLPKDSSTYSFPCVIGSIVWVKNNPNADYADQCKITEFHIDAEFDYMIVKRLTDDTVFKIKISTLGINWFLFNPNINETADLDKE